MSDLNGEVNSLNNKVDDQTGKVDGFRSAVDDLKEEVRRLNGKVDNLNRRVGEGLEELALDQRDTYAQLNNTVNSLENKMIMILHATIGKSVCASVCV